MLVESTILSVILAYHSKEWQYLKCVKSMSPITSGKINIWKEIDLETPELSFKIERYVYDTEGTELRTTVTKESIPYTSWWVGDETSEGGDSRELRSRSQTLVSPAQNKLTFLSLKCSKKAADESTLKWIENARTEIIKKGYGLGPCRIYDDFGEPNEKQFKTLTFIPENMKLPVLCRPSVFWLFTVFPLPFLNGLLLRLIVTKFYSIEI